MQIAPSTYYAAKNRPASARAVRDAFLKNEILRVHRDSGGTYGARRIWRQLQDDGIQVARCTVERLMRNMGISGRRPTQ